MRRLSKILAILLILVIPQVSFAGAAVPADVAGTDYVKSVGKMQSLGIMVGDPSGNFRPNDTIKRSEFAKIAIVALGLSDSAAISAGAAQFSDVAADNWASGFINVASSQGVISGYPDGTFKPDNTITYAEAITIIVRMLGYKPVLEGKPWPGSYVAKANEIGVSNGVVLSPTVGASRGNVAKLMSNTLDSKILMVSSYTDDGKPVYSTSASITLESKLLKIKDLTPAAIVTATDAAIETSSDAAIDTSSSDHHHHHHDDTPSSPTVPTFTVSGTSVNNGGDTVVLTFSEAMDTSTLTENQIGSRLRLYTSNDGITSAGAISVTSSSAVWTSSTVLTITLDESSPVEAYIPADKFLGTALFTGTVKSAAGVATGTSEVFSAGAVDNETTAPTLTVCAINLATSTITLTFDEPVNASTFDLNDFRLRQSVGGAYYTFFDSTATPSGFTDTITITLGSVDSSAISSAFTTGLFEIDAGAVRDIAGNDCNARSDLTY